MKTFIVSLLVVLSAGFTYADESDATQDQPLISLEEAQRLQRVGEGLRLQRQDSEVYGPVDRSGEDEDSTAWRDQQRYRLYQECAQRRATDSTISGDSLVDRAIGNRVRRNLEDNRRSAEDGFDSFVRSDNTVGRVRRDPCVGINPPEPREETDNRGCRFRINGNQKKLIAGSCRF